MGRKIVNARWPTTCKRKNAATFDHLFVLDETELLDRHGESELGRMFYDSDLQHPAHGQMDGRDYPRHALRSCHLMKEEADICDLETPVKGVIGEGAVEHYATNSAF